MSKIPDDAFFERSNDLEQEVGDDLAAYKMTDEELEELLDDVLLGESCEQCGGRLDGQGFCDFCDYQDDDEADPDKPPFADEPRERDFWEGDTPDW